MGKNAFLAMFVSLLIGGFGGWWFCNRDHGGHGSGAPKFRKVKFLNASMNDVKKVKVSRVQPAASELWFLQTPIPKDGDKDDWMALNRALNDPLANSTKVSVEIWVDVGGAERALTAVELDTGAPNQLFTGLVILFDNHWDTAMHATDFQVTLVGTYSDTDEGAGSIKDIQATRTP